MAIIKMDDINKRMTEIAAQYMAKGLTFNCEAMRGSQGEKGKVALGDNKYVYMIYAHDECEDKNWQDRMDVVKITVELHPRDDRNTYWLGRGEVIQEEVYYQVNHSYGIHTVYTDSKEDIQVIREKQHVRFRSSWSGAWKQMKYDEDTIVNIIKAKTGRKRVFPENIIKVEKRDDSNCWQITYKFAGRENSLYVKAEAVGVE